jgi:hypothetical protein
VSGGGSTITSTRGRDRQANLHIEIDQRFENFRIELSLGLSLRTVLGGHPDNLSDCHAGVVGLSSWARTRRRFLWLDADDFAGRQKQYNTTPSIGERSWVLAKST